MSEHLQGYLTGLVIGFALSWPARFAYASWKQIRRKGKPSKPVSWRWAAQRMSSRAWRRPHRKGEPAPQEQEP
jgi:hypothetical protein